MLKLRPRGPTDCPAPGADFGRAGENSMRPLDRREFLRGVTGAAATVALSAAAAPAVAQEKARPWRRTRPEQFFKGFWVSSRHSDDWHSMCRAMAEAGCSKVWPLVERMSREDILRFVEAAHRYELEFHAWMVNNKPGGEIRDGDFLSRNKDWFVVNKNGTSSADVFLFGGSYPWYCPTSEGFRQFQLERIGPFASIAGLQGLHLDFIRYPDIFRYEGSRAYERDEVPEYSFCYCDRCRRIYYSEVGLDPLDIPLDPEDERYQAWTRWRYERITAEVREIREALPSELALSAAVFPTPDIARRNVLQDWPAWGDLLDHLCTMIYTPVQWGRPLAWIETATKEGKQELQGFCKLYAGFGHVVEERRPGELREGILAARRGGADGALVFRYPGPTPEMMREIRQTNEEIGEVEG